MGYVYRGNQFDAHEPITGPVRPIGPRTGPLCGTRSGYMAHRKKKEDPCQPCREANTAYSAEWSSRRKYRPAGIRATGIAGSEYGNDRQPK